MSSPIGARPVRPFYREVYRLVRQIPKGKVATYGQLAALLGRPRAVRAVGSALRRLSGPMQQAVPWHRVLNARGRVSFRDGESPEVQRDLLRREGVRFGRGGSVDLARIGWVAARSKRRSVRMAVFPPDEKLTPRRRFATSRERSD